MKGIKQTLDYARANFSPYQHKTVRIVEFRGRTASRIVPGDDSVLGIDRPSIARWTTRRRTDIGLPVYRDGEVGARGGRTRWWVGMCRGATCERSSAQSHGADGMKTISPGSHERFEYEMDKY